MDGTIYLPRQSGGAIPKAGAFCQVFPTVALQAPLLLAGCTVAPFAQNPFIIIIEKERKIDR